MNLLKKTIAAIAVITISAGMCTAAMADTVQFTDVSEQSSYYEAINYTVSNGLFTGVTDTEFAPDTQLTRGMFVTILGRTYSKLRGDDLGPSETVSETGFKDVAADDYCGAAVYWAWKNGIVSGYDENTFGPNDVLTKEQAVSVMYRFSQVLRDNLLSGGDTNILSYTDYFDISKYAIPAIQWGLENQLITDDGEYFHPAEKVTRGEAAQYLFNYLTKLTGGEETGEDVG